MTPSPRGDVRPVGASMEWSAIQALAARAWPHQDSALIGLPGSVI